MEDYDIAIIGGGAAGFFAAINLARQKKGVTIILLEKSGKLLSKVAISGGGRCNVTHACYNVKELLSHYPRGKSHLKKPFQIFNTSHTVEWFEQCGISLKTEGDGRIFPQSNTSETIVNYLQGEASRKGIKIMTKTGVNTIQKTHKGSFKLQGIQDFEVQCKKILVATGGNPKKQAYQWLANLGHTIVSPVPSLFTFNIGDQRLTALSGITLQHARVQITGTKFREEGPLLITHWGMSGPAILKLSSRAARELFDLNYQFEILINWIPDFNENKAREYLQKYRQENGSRQVGNSNPFALPKRFWQYLLTQSDLPPSTKWAEVSKKAFNRLVNNLIHGNFQVTGKSTFKEEFVTCGGVSLDEVDFSTMESKKIPGLYFAGEVLDIDALTGGFNFQAAWTTGWLAAQAIANKFKISN